MLSVPDEDQFILLGDFNARIGTAGGGGGLEDDWSLVRGPHGFGQNNEAGEELLTFLHLLDAVVCNSWFQHPDIHKATWRHPRSGRWHCIDYAITRRRDLKLCRDVRVVRSAECGTDHIMLGLRYALPSLASAHRRRIVKRKRFDVGRLRLPVDIDPAHNSSSESCIVTHADIYNLEVVGRLHNSWSDGSAVEDKWYALREAVTIAAEGTLGFQRRRRPDWYQAQMDVLEPLLQRRLLLFQKWLDSRSPEAHSVYAHARGVSRAAVRRAKTDWYRQTAEVAEKGKFGQKRVWDAIKSMQTCSGGLVARQSVAVKDARGEVCASVEAQHARWREHFHHVLNVPSEHSRGELLRVRQREIRPELADCPTLEEVIAAIRGMSGGKAGGRSRILPELLKFSNASVLHYVHDLINDVWAKGAVPKDWVDADIVPIPKKGDLTSCDNWRGVALLDVVGKLCAKIILGRLQLLAEDVLPEEQCGFRRGRSCSDMAFVFRQFIEKCHEHRTRAFLVYIDLRKAYDSIPRAALWSVLSRVGVPEHLVRLIESFHSGMSAKVLVDGIGLEDIAVNNGLRQGCCMAPVLFNIYACAVFERWSSRIEDYGDVGLTLRFKLDKKLFRRASVCGAPLSVINGQFADDAVCVFFNPCRC